MRKGESAITVLQRLADPIKTCRTCSRTPGQTPGAGFGQLAVLSGDRHAAWRPGRWCRWRRVSAQALAGLANTGLLSPELFAELANGIGEAYKKLELLGKGGLEAARLMQPSLQAIWQMIQDNPALRDTLDDDDAGAAGLRRSRTGWSATSSGPAIDRMIEALNDLIARLGEFIDAHQRAFRRSRCRRRITQARCRSRRRGRPGRLAGRPRSADRPD